MKNQRKPIVVNSTTLFIEEWMDNRGWSLVDSIKALESGYPFYDVYDVLAQLINYGLLWHAFLFFLKRRFSKKGKIYLKDWRIIIRCLVHANIL